MHINIANNSHLNFRKTKFARRLARLGLPITDGAGTSVLTKEQPQGPVHHNRWNCNVAK